MKYLTIFVCILFFVHFPKVTNAQTVTRIEPKNHQVNVAPNTDITITFDSEINQTSINSNTFLVVSGQTGLLEGTLHYSNKVLTFNPNHSFRPGDMISVILTKNIVTIEGQNIEPYQWNFTVSVNSKSRNFETKSPITIGDWPLSITCADWNLDNKPDLGVANYNDHQAAILMNSGEIEYTKTYYSVGQYPSQIRQIDFNRDGYLDVAVANGTSKSISILKNLGDGTFRNVQEVPVENSPVSLTSGDIDGDGDFDLITTNLNTNSVSLVLNDGDTLFYEANTIDIGSLPYSTLLNDFDNDGAPDLLVMNRGKKRLELYLNDRFGNFSLTSTTQIPDDPVSFTSNDFDGDGDADLAVACVENKIYIFVNSGTGSFEEKDVITAGNLPIEVINSDFNGDHIIDLAVANASSNNVYVLFGNGDGTFPQRISARTGNGPRSLTSGDFDNDGDIDIAVANRDGNSITILENVNLAPVWSLPDTLIIHEDDSLSLNLNDYLEDSNDPDNSLHITVTENANVKVSLNPTTHVVTLNPQKDYYGCEQIAFSATDPTGLVSVDTVLIEVLPVNDAPLAFDLIFPENNTHLDSSLITFVWHSANDIDSDSIFYDLLISILGSNKELRIPNVVDTFYVIDLHSYFSDDSIFQWYVEASDQEATTLSNTKNTFIIRLPKTEKENYPECFALNQNYPNPFNSSTKIKYSIPVNSRVVLSIFDIMGRKLLTLLDSPQEKGFYEITWHGTDREGNKLSSGVYLIKFDVYMENGSHIYSTVKKSVLIK